MMMIIIIGFLFCLDQDEKTALHFASHYGHSEVVKLLLASGANINDQEYVSNSLYMMI